MWDAKVRAVSGGITILKPVKGQWIDRQKDLHQERMIPVRILATQKQMEEIIQMSLKYYNQQAILAYEISNNVLLVHKN